jgi:hypothetical protein
VYAADIRLAGIGASPSFFSSGGLRYAVRPDKPGSLLAACLGSPGVVAARRPHPIPGRSTVTIVLNDDLDFIACMYFKRLHQIRRKMDSKAFIPSDDQRPEPGKKEPGSLQRHQKRPGYPEWAILCIVVSLKTVLFGIRRAL